MAEFHFRESYSFNRDISITFFLSLLTRSISLFQQAELQKMRQQALETKQFIDKQEADEHKLLRIIADADTERLRQKKELDQVSNGISRLRIMVPPFQPPCV